MNSYVRQTPIPADQMHSFLKDKQAWENAIAMYHGPDPLDHWYNYVCWYENHCHGDPENKFRETLERCLTLFEHNDFYKQDPRMTRLWLKYIDMQSNPLHFYQVLYQRGVGRQLAAFYVKWAGYYESVQAAKEAESVYNLAFQEKAQPYVELHHAYNKFVYTRNAAVLQQQQKAAAVGSQQYVSTTTPATDVGAVAVTPPLSQQQLHQVAQTQSSYHRQAQHVAVMPPYAAVTAAAAAVATPAAHLQPHQTPPPQPQPPQSQPQQHLYHPPTQHVSYQSHSPQQSLHTHAHLPHPTLHQSQPPITATTPHLHLPHQQPATVQLHHQHQHHHQQQQHHNPNQHHHHHQHQPTAHEHQLSTATASIPAQAAQPPTQALHQPQMHQHQTQPQPHTLSQHHQHNQHHNQHHHHNNQNQINDHLHHHQHSQHANHLQTHATPHAATEVEAVVSHYHMPQQHMNGHAATSSPLYQQLHQQQQTEQAAAHAVSGNHSAASTASQQVQPAYVHNELNHQQVAADAHSAATTAIVAANSLGVATAPADLAMVSNVSPQVYSSQHNISSSSDLSIGGVCLPRRFAAYCRNNFETWKPALFLEEPPDPSRHCHYAKEHVYPGDGCEYSPEELCLQRYAKRMLPPEPRQQGQQDALQQPQEEVQLPSSTSDEALSATPYQGYYVHDEPGCPLQLHQYVLGPAKFCATLAEAEQPPQANTVATDERERDDGEGEADTDAIDADEAESRRDAEVETNGEEVDEQENDEEQLDDNDDQSDERQMLQQHHQQEQHQQQQQQQMQFNLIAEDLEDQIEASTIRLSQNKTIKIKFRKERTQLGDTFNGSGSNYSAYTVENIYQHEIASPTTLEEHSSRRNGHHSFHPYLMGQTSTPKASALKRTKAKLKRSSNKFQPLTTCSSSNSSSAENAAVPSAHTAEHVQHGDGAAINSAGTATAAAGIIETASNGVIHGATGGCGRGADSVQAIQNANYNDNANYSFLSAAALENSNCSLTSAVDRLNFRDISGVQRATNNNNNSTNTNNNNVADLSTYQENSYFATQHDAEAKERRLQKALETIDRHLARDAIDPFNRELCRAFLTKLDFPGADDATHANYKILQTPLPKIANSRALTLPDGLHFCIDREVGRGTYGSVFKATDVNSGAVLALKLQKPPNTWEIYICDQVLKRVTSPSVLPGLMDVTTAIIAPNASLIATEFSRFGSLLDVNNKIRQATSKVMHESLVMHFAAQICNIVHHLHRQQIIHADIKPDNFLLMRIPSTDLNYPSVRLIDFGCAIDMSLFPQPDQTKFRLAIQTDGFTCIEMQEGRPWSYETDLFCVAATVHVMLMGDYMQLQKRAGTWDIKHKLPRYLKKHVWTRFFGELLNISSATKLPDLCDLRALFDEEAAKMDSELQKQIRTLSNILYRR